MYQQNLGTLKRQNPAYFIVFTGVTNASEIQQAAYVAEHIRESGVEIVVVGLNQNTDILAPVATKLYLVNSAYNISNTVSQEINNFICASAVDPTGSSSGPDNDDLGTQCSSNVSNAWLDVVILVDTSSAMSYRDLSQAGGQLTTIFRPFTISQDIPHSTRVGIVTFGTSSAIRYQLADTTNFDDLGQEFLKLASYHSSDDSGGNIQRLDVSGFPLFSN